MANFAKAIELLKMNGYFAEADLLQRAHESGQEPEPDGYSDKVKWIKWWRNRTGVGLPSAIAEWDRVFGKIKG